MKAKSENSTLNRIYNLTGNPEECVEAYKEWADNYEKDTVDEMGYVAPAIVAEKLASLARLDGKTVLDAGCGTGLAGVELAERASALIDGMDISPDMLALARKKGAYEDLRTADMTGPLDYKTDQYDAVMCVGTFTHAHVGPKGFDELVRITRPGGLVVATVHEDVWDADNYLDHLKAIDASGAAALKEYDVAPYHLHECRLVVLEAR